MGHDTSERASALRLALAHLRFGIDRLEQTLARGGSDEALAAARASAVEAATAAETALSSGAGVKLATSQAAAAESQVYLALRTVSSRTTSAESYWGDIAVGIDLGGTKILAAAVGSDGQILARSKSKTRAGAPVDDIVGRLCEAVGEVLADAQATPERLRGIGIGAPGSINYERGEVVLAPNLDWQDVPLRSMVRDRLSVDCPVHLENDVNIGTLAEAKYGIGRGLRHLVGMFWGTGIGGGVVVDGKLLHGGDGMAAEIGHVIIKPGGARCGCGNRGCLEALASRTGIARQLRRAVRKGRSTWWRAQPAKDLDTPRSGKLAEALAAGDAVTERVLSTAAERIGIVAASVANVLAPDLVIVGGGVMEAMEEQLLPTIRGAFREHLFSAEARFIPVVSSPLADDAGVLGGAAVVWQATADAHG